MINKGGVSQFVTEVTTGQYIKQFNKTWLEDEQPITRWTLDWLGDSKFKSRRITHPESTTDIPNEFYKRKHDHNVHSYRDVNNRLIVTETSIIQLFDVGS